MISYPKAVAVPADYHGNQVVLTDAFESVVQRGREMKSYRERSGNNEVQ